VGEVGSTVRRAEPDDSEAIAAVHVATWRAAYHGLIPQEYLDGLDVTQRAEMWRGVLTADPGARAAGRVLVAEDDAGGVTGFVAFGPLGRGESRTTTVGEVYAIYADPGHWGQAVGHVLMQAALDTLPRMGFRTAHLWALEGNERAERFYLRHGWVVDGGRREEEFGGVAVAVIRYRCSLGRAPAPG
jgi:GNAT superfamily N-acetyltransferase